MLKSVCKFKQNMAKSHKTCMAQAEIIDTFGTYQPTRRWASISSTLERFLMVGQSGFDSKRFADQCCKVCTVMKNKCELYIWIQSSTEFLLLARVSIDFVHRIEG